VKTGLITWCLFAIREVKTGLITWCLFAIREVKTGLITWCLFAIREVKTGLITWCLFVLQWVSCRDNICKNFFFFFWNLTMSAEIEFSMPFVFPRIFKTNRYIYIHRIRFLWHTLLFGFLEACLYLHVYTWTVHSYPGKQLCGMETVIHFRHDAYFHYGR
jgi:hypothetical protein